MWSSLALGMEMLPALNKSLSVFSPSSQQTYPPSHTVSSSYSLSGKKSHKSRKLSHGPNLCFLPPHVKKMFTLLAGSNLYCSTKRYEVAALQVRLENTYIQTRQNLCSYIRK